MYIHCTFMVGKQNDSLRYIGKHICMQNNDGQIGIKIDIQVYNRYTDQTDRQIDIQINRWTDRQIDRWTDRYIYRWLYRKLCFAGCSWRGGTFLVLFQLVGTVDLKTRTKSVESGLQHGNLHLGRQFSCIGNFESQTVTGKMVMKNDKTCYYRLYLKIAK